MHVVCPGTQRRDEHRCEKKSPVRSFVGEIQPGSCVDFTDSSFCLFLITNVSYFPALSIVTCVVKMTSLGITLPQPFLEIAVICVVKISLQQPKTAS